MDFIEELKSAFNTQNEEEFKQLIFQYHPRDVAYAFNDLDKSMRKKLYRTLSARDLAIVFQEMEKDDILEYFTEISSRQVANILENMSTDDEVDILQYMNDEGKLATYLSLMPKEISSEIRRLMNYENETAGSLMTSDFISIPVDCTIKEATKIVIDEAPKAETIYTIFVVDKKQKLVGVISLKELILARDNELLVDVMTTKIISVKAGDDQEDVAALMRQYDLPNIPVIDYRNEMLGIITFDDVYDIIVDEAVEDFEKLAGVSDINEAIVNTPLKNAMKRLPWILILLILGLFIAQIMQGFESTLATITALAFFIPMIAGVTGNTATQSLAITLRRFSNEDDPFTRKQKLGHVAKEVMTGALIGSATAVILFALVYLLGNINFLHENPIQIGAIVAITVFVSQTIATLSGSSIPLIMKKLGADPAIASGPLITTINDIISITVYVSIATLAIQYMN